VNSHPFNRDGLVRAFFFSAFALIIYQLILLAKPFFTALLGATMLAMMFYPLHRRCLRMFHKSTIAAFVSTLGVLLLAVLPLVGLGWFFIRELSQIVPAVQGVMEDLRNQDWPSLEAHFPMFVRHMANNLFGMFSTMNVDLKQVILDHAQTIGVQTTAWASDLFRHILETLMNAVILAVALFFAFRDGERLLKWVLTLVPMEAKHKQTVSDRVYETFRAVVVGSFLTATAQGVAAMIGFLIAGVRLPVVLGIATSMASMLGFSALVTVPVAISLWHSSTGWGIFMLVWGVGVVSSLEHVLKPILIGSRAHMPFILIFFSIVGGIMLYGLLGFLLGPMLVASFLSFVKIYQEEYEKE
jgi:predicted PurR-regulated permease PerM